jgi:hypothetical protein
LEAHLQPPPRNVSLQRANQEGCIRAKTGSKRQIWQAKGDSPDWSNHLGPKYVVVVYHKEKEEKVIITAYFTSDLKKVKGEMVWRAYSLDPTSLTLSMTRRMMSSIYLWESPKKQMTALNRKMEWLSELGKGSW